MRKKINHLLGAVLALLVSFGITHSAAAQSGDRIVFSAPVTVQNTSHKGKPTYTTTYQIFSMDSDGNNVQQLTSSSLGADAPMWSTDHNFISFDDYGSYGGGLCIMESQGVANGGRVFNLGLGLSALSTIRIWFPDDDMICFPGRSIEQGGTLGEGLWVVPLDVATEEVGTPTRIRDGSCNFPAVSPDGTKIAFQYANSDLNVAGLIKVLDLTTGGEITLDLNTICEMPSWSPDGTKIAFDAWVTETVSKGKKTTTYACLEVFIANADGTGITQVTHLKSSTRSPSWAPGGGMIAFTSNVDGSDAIYRMDLGTGVITFLHEGRLADW